MGVDSGIGNKVGIVTGKKPAAKPVAPAPRSTVTANPYLTGHTSAVAEATDYVTRERAAVKQLGAAGNAARYAQAPHAARLTLREMTGIDVSRKGVSVDPIGVGLAAASFIPGGVFAKFAKVGARFLPGAGRVAKAASRIAMDARIGTDTKMWSAYRDSIARQGNVFGSAPDPWISATYAKRASGWPATKGEIAKAALRSGRYDPAQVAQEIQLRLKNVQRIRAAAQAPVTGLGRRGRLGVGLATGYGAGLGIAVGAPELRDPQRRRTPKSPRPSATQQRRPAPSNRPKPRLRGGR